MNNDLSLPSTTPLPLHHSPPRDACCGVQPHSQALRDRHGTPGGKDSFGPPFLQFLSTLFAVSPTCFIFSIFSAFSQHFPSIFWILWNPRGTPPGQGTCSPAAPVATRPARAPRCAAAVEWSSGNGSQSPGRPGATELENLPFILYIYI